MKFMAYILKCIMGLFDAFVGKNSNNTFFDGLVGIVTLVIVMGVFVMLTFILSHKTRLNYGVSIFLSILSTIIIVIAFFVIAYLIERMF